MSERNGWIGAAVGVALILFVLYGDLLPVPLMYLAGMTLLAFCGVRILTRNAVMTKSAVWGISVIVLLIIGVVTYVYIDGRVRERPVLHGKFDVTFLGWKFPGTAKLEDNGKRLMLQFKVPARVFVKSFSLDSIPASHRSRLRMVCALHQNFEVAYCTSDTVSGFTDIQNTCLDNEFYTTSLWFYEPLEVESLDGVAFSVVTSRGDNRVVVRAN